MYNLLHAFPLALVFSLLLERFLNRDCLEWYFEAHGLHRPLEIEYLDIALGRLL